MFSWYHKTIPPTSPASSPATCSDAPSTLNYLPAPPHIPSFPTCVKLLILSSLPAMPPLPHSHGNPSHPSRPSSNVISSVKALLIFPTGCAFFLRSMISDSTFFVPLLLGHFSYSAAICFLLLVSLQPLPPLPYEILRSLEAKTILPPTASSIANYIW